MRLCISTIKFTSLTLMRNYMLKPQVLHVSPQQIIHSWVLSSISWLRIASRCLVCTSNEFYRARSQHLLFLLRVIFVAVLMQIQRIQSSSWSSEAVQRRRNQDIDLHLSPNKIRHQIRSLWPKINGQLNFWVFSILSTSRLIWMMPLRNLWD
jgi:hypothetical protein